MLPAPGWSGHKYTAKRTPADNQTVRNVFVIDPDKKIKAHSGLSETTPVPNFSFARCLRVIDSLHLHPKQQGGVRLELESRRGVITSRVSVTDDYAKKQ